MPGTVFTTLKFLHTLLKFVIFIGKPSQPGVLEHSSDDTTLSITTINITIKNVTLSILILIIMTLNKTIKM
jgi:hypothetical protein